MTNPTQVESIVAGLSEAQKQALLTAVACKGGEYWTPYQRLFRNGLGRPELVKGGVLRPLALAVRKALEDAGR